MMKKKASKKRTSVYVLTAIHARVHNDCKKGHYVFTERGDVKCWREKVGVFSSVKKAEAVIKQLVSQEKKFYSETGDWYNAHFGFMLDEHYLDDALYGDDEYKNTSSFESQRSYLSNGTLNCTSDLDERCEKKFYGRKEPIVHVKSGDIAIEFCGDHLTPILVEAVAWTAEEWKAKMKKGASGDYTDDSGIAFIADYGHCHPASTHTFPLSCLPCYKVTKELRKKLEKERKAYLTGKC